jgi:outer membrane lipoprotein-sorting protein
MRTNPLSLLAAACLSAIALAFSVSPATAGTPSAADLIAMAPVIRSSDEEVRSIEVAGYARDHGKIIRTFRALYRTPDRFVFIVRDGQDGIPISIAVDKKVLMYDPVRPEILVQPHASSYRTLKVEGGEYHDTWGFTTSGRKPCRIEIDLKSVFTAPSKDGTPVQETVTKEGEGVHVLTRKDDKTYRRLRVDRRGPTPVIRYETASSPGGPPTYGIDRMIVNGALDDSEFTFPPLDKLAGSLKVRDVKDGLFSEADAMNVLMRIYYVRQKLHEPKSDRGVITPLLAGVHWSRVEENDERYAKLVRALIPADPVHRVVDLPGMADGDEAVERTGWDAIRDHLPHLPYKIKFRVEAKSDDRP